MRGEMLRTGRRAAEPRAAARPGQAIPELGWQQHLELRVQGPGWRVRFACPMAVPCSQVLTATWAGT